MSEQQSRRTRCSICHLPRPAAERGECNVPMPAPQPPECLMVTIEREALASTDREAADA